MENQIKVNTSEIVMKVSGAVIGVMMAIISYFLVNIDQNIKLLSEKSTRMEQNFAVKEATSQGEKEITSTKFRQLELQIEDLKAQIIELKTGNQKKK
jgi:hypothetical protein